MIPLQKGKDKGGRNYSSQTGQESNLQSTQYLGLYVISISVNVSDYSIIGTHT